ncbi:MAG: hypothetical protein U0359_05875 [Byssovorax sp.]
MSHPPLELSARDFDAYAAEKATSNAYSRPRLELKQKALGWARRVVARLADLGLSVDVHGSDEHPTLRNKKRVDCQWVFFWRDQAARDELDRLLDRGRTISQVIDDPSPFARHAFLAFRLDAESVEVCFAVHPEAKVDVDNLRARLDDEGALGELTSALAALPEEFRIGVRAEDRVACAAATRETMHAMLERAAAGQVPLWIGWSVRRDMALAHADTLGEQLEDALVALAPLYKLVAWSRDNDRIALDRRLAGVEDERARAHAEAEAQNERWRAEQAEARRRSAEQAAARSEEARSSTPLSPPAPPARKPSLDTLFTHGSARAALAAGAREATVREAVAEARTLRPSRGEPVASPVAIKAALLTTPASPAGSTGGSTSHGARSPSSGALEKGARVRVLSGPFADKIGVIGELDGRGGARVLLGLLSTRVDLGELEPSLEGRERPALQSSHRKPLAPPPRKAR